MNLGMLVLVVGIVLGIFVTPWCFLILLLPLLGTLEDEFDLSDYLIYDKGRRKLVRELRDIKRRYRL